MYSHGYDLLLLLALTCLPSISCRPGSLLARSAPEVKEPLVLHPIALRDYESATGLRRRGEDDFSDLDPATQSQLIYGSPGDNGQLLLANMTLYAPDGLPIVLMERFEGLTSAVDCKGDDGAMSLTFKSKKAYNYAFEIWGKINEDDDKQFLLIANHDGCGRADERQPYKVSSVRDDSADLTIKMKTTVAKWSEVAGSYDLSFGKAIPHQPKDKLKPRGFWGDIVNVGKDALKAAEGSVDLTKTVTFDVNVGTPGKKTNIYTDEKGRFSLDCIDCYITGSWGVQGQLSVKNFVLQDLILEASPSNFKAKLELEATVTSSKSPESIQNSITLFSAPIPGAGISVSGIFKLGATVSYDVGTSATFAGTATADFGLSASLPNGAKVIADVNNPSDSSAPGWTGSSLTPNFEVTKLSATITLAAYSQPKISFGIELIDVGKVDIAVTMKLPEISSTLSANYDANGACPSSSSKTGVKLENKADESLDLQIDLDLGDDNKKPSWSKQLLDFPQSLGSDCIPLNIPGLGPSGPSSAAPAPSSPAGGGSTCNPPGKGAGICQKTSIACAGGDYVSGLCPGDSSIKCCPNAAPSSPAPTPSAAPTTCTPPGKTGICQDTSKTCAGGSYISGYCPGDNSIECCSDKSASAAPTTTCAPPGKKGICQSTSTTCSGGGYISSYCPGDNSIQCCPDKPASTPAPAATTCSPPGKKGICQSTSTTCSGGDYISGYCPGDDSIKCCASPTPSAPAGGGACKMRRDRFGKRMLVC